MYGYDVMIVYSIVYSGADQRKHQSSASLAFVRGIHRWPVNSPLKGPVTREMFPFDGVIMALLKPVPLSTSLLALNELTKGLNGNLSDFQMALLDVFI